jgi:hypothetical protein
MADNQRTQTDETARQPRDNEETERIPSTDSESERERVRSSNDRDQDLEREGVESRHNRGYDETARGQARPQQGPTDPDSAESDVDRDDTIAD